MFPPFKKWRPVPFALRVGWTRWLAPSGQNRVEVTVGDFQGWVLSLPFPQLAHLPWGRWLPCCKDTLAALWGALW